MYTTIKKNKWWILIFIICTVPRFFISFINQESNDDHAETVKQWMMKGEYPAVDDCFECFQPPAYYWVIKNICKLNINNDKPVIYATMKWVNFVFGIFILLYIIYACTFFNLWIGYQYIIALFWGLNPKLIAICAQMTNDTAIILLGLIYTHLLYLFFKNYFVFKKFFYLVIIASLAALTKGTGLLFIGVTALLLLYLILANKVIINKLWISYGAVLFAAIICVAYFGNYYRKYQENGNPFITNWKADNPPNFFKFDSSKARLGITTVSQSFFTFRIFDLVINPAIENGYKNTPINRTSFFTMLYAQYSNVFYEQYPHGWRNKDPLPTLFAQINYIVQLPLLLVFIFGVIQFVKDLLKRKQVDYYFCLFLLFCIFMFFLIYYAYIFRDFSFIKVIFIFPILASIIHIFFRGIMAIKNKKYLMYSTVLLLSISSILYLINLYYLYLTLMHAYN